MEQAASDYVLAVRVLHTGSIIMTHAVGGRYAPPRSGVSDFVMINELKDGRIWRDRRYYAEPFEAPEWRAEWVERVEF
jgi:hypothetical protein